MEKLEGRSGTRLRVGAKHPGREARADRAREQHGLAQAFDDHGAHARLALGQGHRRVRVRRSSTIRSKHLPTHVPTHEGAHGAGAPQGSGAVHARHRGRVPRAAPNCSTEFRLKVERRRLSLVRDHRAAAVRCGGQAAGLVGVTQDVTARRESEAKLRRSEQLLRTTTANTADTLLLVDTDLRRSASSIAVSGISISRRSSAARSRRCCPKRARDGDRQAPPRARDGRDHHLRIRVARRGGQPSISRIAPCWSGTTASARASRSASPISPSASAWSRRSSMSRAASATPSAAICTTAWARS